MELHRRVLKALGPKIFQELELTPRFLSYLFSNGTINQAEYGRLKVSEFQSSSLSNEAWIFVIARTWSKSRDGRRQLRASSPFSASRTSTHSGASLRPWKRLPKTSWRRHGLSLAHFAFMELEYPGFRKSSGLLTKPWSNVWQSYRITIQRKLSTRTSRIDGCMRSKSRAIISYFI